MQGWKELATGHIGNTSKCVNIHYICGFVGTVNIGNTSKEINHTMCNCTANTWCILWNGVFILLWHVIWIFDTYTEDTSLGSLGVCCGLWRIRISGKGRDAEKRSSRAGKGNMRIIMREPPILCLHCHWLILTMRKPKAWLTSSNYDGRYQLQLGVGGNTVLGSNINQFSLLCCAMQYCNGGYFFQGKNCSCVLWSVCLRSRRVSILLATNVWPSAVHKWLRCTTRGTKQLNIL